VSLKINSNPSVKKVFELKLSVQKCDLNDTIINLQCFFVVRNLQYLYPQIFVFSITCLSEPFLQVFYMKKTELKFVCGLTYKQRQVIWSSSYY